MNDHRAELEWQSSSSSNVERYAYDRDRQRLYVQFRTGGSGYYSNVPPPVYEAFRAASSQGRFINQRLRDNPAYPWTPLTASMRRHSTRWPDPYEVRYRLQCPICGATGTVADLLAPMPKHRRKGDTSPYKLDCPGSGGYGINLRQAPPRRPRRSP